jgi:signal peptidase II
MVKYFLTITSLFILDRVSKIYVIHQPYLSQLSGGWLVPHLNQNIAFSLPMLDFIIYPLVVIILVFLVKFWLRSFKKKEVLVWPWGLLIIGAFSNLLDRISYGAIIDFINLPWLAVLNIADIYISLSAAWLLWALVFPQRLKSLTKI